MTAEVEQQQEVRGGSLVRLVADPKDIVDSWKEFENLKSRILTEADYQSEEGRRYVKKSGWRKIAGAFGINIQNINSEKIELGEGHFAIKWVVRAVAPGGRYSDGVGSCDNKEKRFLKRGFKYHDVEGTAYTRAVNRAVSDLVGGGEVSAEEVSAGPDFEYLPEKWQARLAELVAKKGEAGYDTLARFILAELDTKFLSQEQAARIGAVLKVLPDLAGKPEPVTVASAKEIFDAVEIA
jgi:hypothetical protein